MSADPGYAGLTIENVRGSDFGVYECTVRIGQQSETKQVQLNQANTGSGDDTNELTILDDFISDSEPEATIDPDCLEVNKPACPGKKVFFVVS